MRKRQVVGFVPTQDRRQSPGRRASDILAAALSQPQVLASVGILQHALESVPAIGVITPVTTLLKAQKETGKAAVAKTSKQVPGVKAGRAAGRYVAQKSTGALKNVNETVTKIFSAIANAGASGMTQREVMDTLDLPHSTVWYALIKLKKRGALKYAKA